MRTPLAASLSLLLAACASPGAPERGPADVVVELDAFSGLPNPTWTLSAAEAGELAARLRDLPRADATLPAPVLGYRGFRVRNPGGEGGVPEVLYVSRAGWVLVGEPGEGGELYQDRRASQALLIAAAERRGYAEVVRR